MASYDKGALITRLFRLERDLSQRAWFDEVGEHNLTTSIEKEPGTLAMYSTHMADQPQTCYVFEVYADEDAYNVHATSGQFQAFVNMAGQVLTGREVIPVHPELLLEKREPLRVTDGTVVRPRLARITVKPECDAAFREAVFANMRASVVEEDGVLVLYAATLANDASQWVFWEVYASDEAYAAHCATSHFKTYIAKTADCLLTKELFDLRADTLVSKGEFVA